MKKYLNINLWFLRILRRIKNKKNKIKFFNFIVKLKVFDIRYDFGIFLYESYKLKDLSIIKRFDLSVIDRYYNYSQTLTEIIKNDDLDALKIIINNNCYLTFNSEYYVKLKPINDLLVIHNSKKILEYLFNKNSKNKFSFKYFLLSFIQSGMNFDNVDFFKFLINYLESNDLLNTDFVDRINRTIILYRIYNYDVLEYLTRNTNIVNIQTVYYHISENEYNTDKSVILVNNIHKYNKLKDKNDLLYFIRIINLMLSNKDYLSLKYLSGLNINKYRNSINVLSLINKLNRLLLDMCYYNKIPKNYDLILTVLNYNEIKILLDDDLLNIIKPKYKPKKNVREI